MTEQFTKKQLEEIVLWYADEYGDNDCPYVDMEWCKSFIETVEIGDDVIDCKVVYSSDVYKVQDTYFEVTNYRSNSGYWGDSEREEPTIHQVVPKEITKTVWVAVKQGE